MTLSFPTRRSSDLAGGRAVDGHWQRCHPGARVEGLSHGHYRVRWPLPTPAPEVSLVIPTRDKVELLRTCVDSLLERTTYPSFQILVVANRSSEPEALGSLVRQSVVSGKSVSGGVDLGGRRKIKKKNNH